MNSIKPIEITNAIITRVTLRIERGFVLDSWVFVEYESGGQGFGGFVLGGYPDTRAGHHDEQTNIAAEWIVSVMRAADVEDWDHLKGRSIRVRREGGFNGVILGIGHITKNDRWFMARERFAQMMKKSEAPA